jgi:prolyl-tRNA synthetase
MKDAYSFHATQESLEEHYAEMSEAYGRICTRLGLDYRPVEADSGLIGGKVTIEYMALADTGEAALVYCRSCDYAANDEAASTVVPRRPAVTEPGKMEKVSTPGLKTIAELAEAFEVSEHDTVKTMVGRSASGLAFFLVPGDRELNPLKAERVVPGVRLLDEEDFDELGLPKGSLGPVDAPERTRIIADRCLETEVSFNVGANVEDFHYFGAVPGRDFEVDEWADLVLAEPGDRCPECDAVLEGARGIEVGQVFQLGTKYSEAMGATFADEDGVERPFLMGCYGVGVSRALAAVIEQHADDDGVAWPVSVAPFEVVVIPLGDDDLVGEVSERLSRELFEAGIEVVLDDRAERAGVKFADADLIGFPFQIVVGSRSVKEGSVEVKVRSVGERTSVPIPDAAESVAQAVRGAREADS